MFTSNSTVEIMLEHEYGSSGTNINRLAVLGMPSTGARASIMRHRVFDNAGLANPPRNYGCETMTESLA